MSDLVQKIALIGDSASGKTCFISILRWLGEPNVPSRFSNKGANGNSKIYLDELFHFINQGMVPPGSERETDLQFSEEYVPADGQERTTFNFRLHDFRGGDLKNLDKDAPLFQVWAKCDVLLLMLDVEKVQSGGQDLRENLHALWEVLSQKDMRVQRKRLAVVLTQADKAGFTCENHSQDAALAFLDQYLPDFHARLKSAKFRAWKCFLLASFGYEPEKGANGLVRLKVEQGAPVLKTFGYDELFGWLVVVKRRLFLEWLAGKSMPYVLSVVALAVLALSGFAFSGYLAYQALRKAMSENATLLEKAAQTHKMAEKDRTKFIEDRIDEYQRQLEKCGQDLFRLKEFTEDEEVFWQKAKISEVQRKRVQELKTASRQKAEDGLVDQICRKVKDPNEVDMSVQNDIDRYNKNDFITKDRAGEVEAAGKVLTARGLAIQRVQIAQCVVASPNDTTKMAQKLGLILSYSGYQGKEKEEANRAVQTMRTLMETGNFTVKRIYAGMLLKKYDLFAMMASDIGSDYELRKAKDQGHPVLTCDEKKEAIEPDWNDLQATIAWRPGQRIRLELYLNEWYRPTRVIADRQFEGGWLTLLELLAQRHDLTARDWDFANGPWIQVSCAEFPEPEKDLELIKKYVWPGTYWQEN